MHQTSEEGNSNALISAPVMRISIGAKTGLSGKELTQHIKNLVREGGGSRLSSEHRSCNNTTSRARLFVRCASTEFGRS